METLILLIMGTCLLGMVLQFLQKEVDGKVFGYAAMFLFIHSCASMLVGFLADEGLLTVQKLMGLSQTKKPENCADLLSSKQEVHWIR